MSAKFEITRYHSGDEIRTTVSKSGMVRSKHSFKGYDGNQCVIVFHIPFVDALLTLCSS